MKALTLATISTLSLITLGGAVYAAGPGMGPGMGPMGMGPMAGPMKMFTEADTNKDGKLDPAEVAAFRDKHFAEASTDGKDGVTIQEFEPWFWKQHREMMVRAFQRLDTDGDGVISKTEADAATDRMLSRLDRDKDGNLTMPERPQRGWDRHGERGPRHERPGMMQRWMGWNDDPAANAPADEAPAAPAN